MNKNVIIDSVAYCGLICILCHKADQCNGCKSENTSCDKYLSDEGCFQRSCCINKNINGCWECSDFPCDKDMYSSTHDPKIKAFARCIQKDGIKNFIDYVLENKKKGLDVRFQKDYDNRTEEDVLKMLRTGKS